MKEERILNFQEFAQFTIDKIERMERQMKGIHMVMNGFANELRNTEPAAAQRIATFISTMAEKQGAPDQTKEIVDMYVGILTHEFREKSELQ